MHPFFTQNVKSIDVKALTRERNSLRTLRGNKRYAVDTLRSNIASSTSPTYKEIATQDLAIYLGLIDTYTTRIDEITRLLSRVSV